MKFNNQLTCWFCQQIITVSFHNVHCNTCNINYSLLSDSDEYIIIDKNGDYTVESMYICHYYNSQTKKVHDSTKSFAFSYSKQLIGGVFQLHFPSGNTNLALTFAFGEWADHQFNNFFPLYFNLQELQSMIFQHTERYRKLLAFL